VNGTIISKMIFASTISGSIKLDHIVRFTAVHQKINGNLHINNLNHYFK